MTNSQRQFGGIVGFGDDFDSVIENCFVTAVNVNGSKSVFLSDVDKISKLNKKIDLLFSALEK